MNFLFLISDDVFSSYAILVIIIWYLEKYLISNQIFKRALIKRLNLYFIEMKNIPINRLQVGAFD